MPGGADTEQMAREIEQDPDYRVLRRLNVPENYRDNDGSSLLRCAFLDVETTGLNHQVDEVIEVGLVEFTYSEDGRIFSVPREYIYSGLNEPQKPLPPEITSLTGITPEMLVGQKIDAVQLEEKVRNCGLIIAHNAAFDRKFVEKAWPFFTERPWACSMRDIDWAAEGITENRKLDYLGAQFGFFFEGHRATADCLAGIEILSRKLPQTEEFAMSQLRRNARKSTFRIYATGAHFDVKDTLKNRGYTWNDGSNGKPRAWWIDVNEDKTDPELDWLAKEIFGSPRNLPIDEINAFNRYSDRADLPPNIHPV